MTKKVLSYLLTVALVLSIVSFAPLTASAATPIDPTGTTTWDFTTATADGSGTGWTWVQATTTLTLTNLTHTTTAATALRVPADTTIVLVDDSMITSTYSGNSDSYGIRVTTGDLTINSITGGSLNVTSGDSKDGVSYGIYASGNLTISNNAEVNVESGASASSLGGYSAGIETGSSLSIIDNAAVTATGGTATDGSSSYKGYSLGIAASGNLTISDNASVTAAGGAAPGNSGVSIGIQSKYGVTISGGANVTATGGVSGDYSYGIWTQNGDVTIDGNAEVTATGGTATGNSYGIKASGTTIGGDAAANATGGTASSGDSCGLYGGNILIISGNAEVTAAGAASNNNSYGGQSMGIWSGGIEISDNASVIVTSGTATGGSTGSTVRVSAALGCDNLTVNGNASVTASGGTVSGAKSYSWGINAQTLTINGGAVIAAGGNAGEESCGIRAVTGEGKITINGGAINASGGTCTFSYGINSSNISFDDGTITAAGASRAIISNYTVPNEYKYWTNTDADGTSGTADNGTSNGSFVIDSTHRYAKIEAPTATPSTDATITAYNLGGVTNGSLGAPQVTYNHGSIAAGAVTLSPAQATSAAFSATKNDAGATLRYAYTATDTAPSFGAWSNTTVAGNGYVWIECTAEDNTTVLIYKVKVTIAPVNPNGTNKWDFTTVTVDGSGTDWAWVQNTKTLTLTNLTHSTGAAIALHVPNGTTIVLVGTNSITQTGFTSSSNGINSQGSLTITGNGSLTAASGATTLSSQGSFAIYANGHLKIESGTINAMSGTTAGGGTSPSLAIVGVSVEITGGTITATGGSSTSQESIGIRSYTGSISITGGTVNATGNTATGDSFGIRAGSGNVSITGGTVTAKGEDRAIYNGLAEDFTLPEGFSYTMSANSSGTPATSGTSDGSFKIGGTHKYAKIEAPAYGDTKIDIAAIPGVTAPARGAAPKTTITDTAQYTGTITWSPTVGSTFAASTIYTAEITLTAKDGFTLDGVAEDFFTVAGATSVTNAADSGVITAVFPTTGAASTGGGGGGTTYFTVTFDTNGGSAVKSASVARNSKVTKPADPTKDGFIFDGWYADKALTMVFDFNTAITNNITVYAKWTEKTVTPDPTDPTEPTNPTPPVTGDKWFNDVKSGDWFYNDVKYVFDNGLFTGTSEDTFSPDEPMTRAMIVTVLWRMAGADKMSVILPSPFDDVANGQWYSAAVAWAAANNIVNGIGGGLFAPDAEITRQDLTVMIMRYIEFIKYEYVVTEEYRLFADEDEIVGYAKNAIQVLNKLGIINGKGNNAIDPQGKATRAEVAAMLHRFSELVK